MSWTSTHTVTRGAGAQDRGAAAARDGGERAGDAVRAGGTRARAQAAVGSREELRG